MHLLEVKELTTYFYTKRGIVKAVNGVSFTLNQGETLGLVGESGCGKSVTSLSILRLLPKPAAKIVQGQILFNGEDLRLKSDKEMRKARKQMAMILQDPTTALNPVFTIGNQVSEAFQTNGFRNKNVKEKVIDLLRQVRIADPETRLRAYPHQLSGGMKQRIVGAIALAREPKLLIADEPTTALDATLQLQYLYLLKELQQKHNFGMIFVTHDFGIVAKICHRVAVMYAGRIVEIAPADEIFESPVHPYTQALIQSVPKVEERVTKLYSIEGEPPNPLHLPIGCAFQSRCRYAKSQCSESFPPLVHIKDNHEVRCWKYTNE